MRLLQLQTLQPSPSLVSVKHLFRQGQPLRGHILALTASVVFLQLALFSQLCFTLLLQSRFFPTRTITFPFCGTNKKHHTGKAVRSVLAVVPNRN